VATAATRVVLACAVACALASPLAGAPPPAHAGPAAPARPPGPAADLGDAFRAYDAGDLDATARLLARIDETAIANRDYLHWLRGMVALRTGDPAGARTAFERLGKLPGSRFAREVPWRLADAAWDAGDRAGAARQYARLADVKGAGAAADVGTARFRIAETRTRAAATAAYRQFLLAHPGRPPNPPKGSLAAGRRSSSSKSRGSPGRSAARDRTSPPPRPSCAPTTRASSPARC
jgi:hypothetical protein